MNEKPETYYSNLRTDTLRDIRATKVEAALELGGGAFGTLAAISDRFNAKAVGIDIVDICENPAIDVIVGSLNDRTVFDRLEGQKFDLVVANDVLEHLLDSAMVLSELYAAMTPGAYLHISVPNIRQVRALYHIFVRGTFPKGNSGLFDRTHVSWFCMSDIRGLVENAGFTVEEAYMKGRFVPSFWRSGPIAELLGLQSILIARKP